MDNSLGSKLKNAKYRPAGFDYLRIVLALMVVILHGPFSAFGSAGADMVWNSPFSPLFRMVVPMFFALSGFLVAGSYERCSTLLKFFCLRIIRIFPALVVETIVSALILGPLLTVLPLSQYFTDPLFFKYFFNMLGEPQYHLPGLFVNNPGTLVNGQLWAVPYELGCYITIALMGVVGGRNNKLIAPLAFLLLTAATLGAIFFYWHAVPTVHRALPGISQIAAFTVGVSVYQFRDKLPGTPLAGLVAFLASLIFLSVPGYLPLLAPIPLAYFTVYVGCLNPKRIALLRGADYSYGVYLYGLPIQQAFVCIFPKVQSGTVTAIVGVAVSLCVAALSWHFVEEPATRLRGQIDKLEQLWLRFKPGFNKPGVAEPG